MHEAGLPSACTPAALKPVSVPGRGWKPATLEEQERQRLVAIARQAIEPFLLGERVRFTAVCWRVRGAAWESAGWIAGG